MHHVSFLSRIAIALFLLTPCVAARAQDEKPFYAGKKLTILVNFAPGGPSDIEGRLLARHIGKHIPGSPAIIVQNMDGAGGQVGTNYLGEVAPRDGSMVGYLGASLFDLSNLTLRVASPQSCKKGAKTLSF